MDRRLRQRLTVRLEARVLDVTCEGQSAQGRMTDVSDAGVCVILPVAIEPGHLVRVEFSEGSLYGQIVHATSDGEEFRTGIEVFQVLLGNSDLARLLEHVMGKPKAVSSPVPSET